jgi:copper chaperone CopZ
VNCPPRVTRAIESVKGVRSAKVSFSEERADVTSDRCAPDVYQAIAHALEQAGYGGQVLETAPLTP